MILVRVSFNTVGLFGDMTSKGLLADWRAVTAHSASAESYAESMALRVLLIGEWVLCYMPSHSHAATAKLLFCLLNCCDRTM